MFVDRVRYPLVHLGVGLPHRRECLARGLYGRECSVKVALQPIARLGPGNSSLAVNSMECEMSGLDRPALHLSQQRVTAGPESLAGSSRRSCIQLVGLYASLSSGLVLLERHTAVHRLYPDGGTAVAEIGVQLIVDRAVDRDGKIDRDAAMLGFGDEMR